MRILITLLIMALPLQVRAEFNCSIIDALERIQYAQLRLSNTRTIDANSGDAQLIIREVGRLDSSTVRFATAVTLAAPDVARMTAFVAMSESLRQTLITRQTNKTIAIFQDPSFDQHISNAKRILPMFNCNPLTQVLGQDGLEKVSSTLGKSTSGKKISITKIGFWLVGMIAAGGVGVVIYSAISKNQERQKRRAKRYLVHIPTRIQIGDVVQVGTILDISGKGVKIQTGKLETDTQSVQLDVWLDDAWRRGRITWSNAHYIGVQFNHSIPHARVIALSEIERKSVQKTKTAPV